MERHIPSGERQPSEHGEIEKAAAERLKDLERHTAEHAENRREAVEEARHQMRQVEQAPPRAESASIAEPIAAYRPIMSRAVNYAQTLASLQHRMRPSAHSFSKFIHSRPVETTSEVLGKTVFRPSISLGATSTAVVVAGAMYLFARYYGIELRGSEIWISLIVGAVVGLLVEVLFKLLRRAGSRVS